MTSDAPSIFYDLETTDSSPVGQILNFAFFLVDKDFSVLERFFERVRISRLQLPQPGAIRANRTDILEHQREAILTEQEASTKIYGFLERCIKRFGEYKVPLIGFNSSGFDLGFIRTVFARNGLYPYIKVIHRDLLLVARKLQITSEDFRKRIFAFAGENGNKVSVKLETLSKIFGVLEGPQQHESSADVEITIKLARAFKENYGIDVRTYEPYDIKAQHREPRGSVFNIIEPVVYALKPESFINESPRTLLLEESSAALWVDLKRYQNAKEKGEPLTKSVCWCKYADHVCIVKGAPLNDPDLLNLATEALQALAGVSMETFFAPAECDVEAWIYKLKKGEVFALAHALKTGETKGLTKDGKQLYRRFLLENATVEQAKSAEYTKMLKDYAHYRYGGKLQVAKVIDPDKPKRTDFHPTLKEMFLQLTSIENEGDSTLKALMASLKSFYLESEIYKLTGEELLAVQPCTSIGAPISN